MKAKPLTRPWTLRVLEAVPLSPAAFGVLFSVALLFLHVFVHAVTGRLEDARIAGPIFWERPGWWTEVVNVAVLGYLAAMIRYGLRGAARDLEDLRSVLRCSGAEFAVLQRELTLFDPRPLLAITAERALSGARAAEREISRGEWRGPLHGIPFTVKDLFDAAGTRTTAASRAESLAA